MIKTKHFSFNGLELDANEPITPRTREFLVSKGVIVQQKDGWINVTGNFSISTAEVAVFLASKRSAPTPKP